MIIGDLEMNEIKVSISCIAYNQEDYIADAIESFLMQKTNFKYEILIHDDASTDKTAEIIKEYEKNFPDIIRGVYQTENQYSKGIKVTTTFLAPLYKGKYVAVCEGDDYWIDENKLQKQYDYMEAHPDCNLCVHGSVEVKADTKTVLSKSVISDKIEEYDIVDAIKGIGRKVATNSFFCRTEYRKMTPDFMKIAPCGDYVLPILCTKDGGSISYLPYIMSAHRARAKNSMNESWNKDSEKLKIYYERFDDMLVVLDEYTDYTYSEYIKAESVRNWYVFYVWTKNKKKLKEEPYKSYKKSLNFKVRLRQYALVNFPFVISLLRKIKHRVLDYKARLK